VLMLISALLDSQLGIVDTEFRTVSRERQMAGLVIDEDRLGRWARLPLSAEAVWKHPTSIRAGPIPQH